MRIACCIAKATDTLRIRNTYCSLGQKNIYANSPHFYVYRHVDPTLPLPHVNSAIDLRCIVIIFRLSASGDVRNLIGFSAPKIKFVWVKEKNMFSIKLLFFWYNITQILHFIINHQPNDCAKYIEIKYYIYCPRCVVLNRLLSAHNFITLTPKNSSKFNLRLYCWRCRITLITLSRYR